ncbi:MAG: glycosyltransferase [Akkermansia sp.]|nr:glycosyltransferase [Akkermansia sp.]
MAEKPKIAILSNFPAWLYTDKLPVFRGHYGVWLVALHEAFAHQDEFEIHWVVLNKNAAAPLRFTSHGQHIHVLPRMKRNLGLYSLYLWDRRAVAKELALIKPDLVHSWGTEDCYGLCAKDFRRGVKLHSVQGALRTSVQRASYPRFVRHHSLYEPGVWKSIRHITAESPWAISRVREVAPHADVKLFEYAVEERFFQLERKLAPSPVCIFSGDNAPIKNLNTVIKAFSRPELSHVTLKLVGVPSSPYPVIPPDLTPNIIPMGRVNRQEMAETLASAWALVHMSLADTGPTAVKEARVVGVPVVLSNECGSCQHVVEGQSGYILNPYDVDGLVRAVLAVTKDAQTAQAMGEYGREECRRTLSGETMVASLLAIYRELLSSGAPA